jgi:ABC-type transport system substrate-binding protein
MHEVAEERWPFWCIIGGNEVVTVHLKPGMRWSDGSPITPADYVGSQLLHRRGPCSRQRATRAVLVGIDIAELAWGLALDDVYLFFRSTFDPSQIPDRTHPDGNNFACVWDLTLIGYLAQAQRTVEEEKRQRLYDQVQNDMDDEACWIPLFAKLLLSVVKPDAYGWWGGGTPSSGIRAQRAEFVFHQ